ncbi:hypothetical protein F4824DRAFT_486941 [Ustulina deusta]|nr:hypothetical protein F4824DRAFT_486941 [Ustulina deusta]
MESSENENLEASFAGYPPQPPHAHQFTSHLQQSTPPRQYTTVGSLYNPQPQPLQPPVRRGRTVKSLFPYKSDSPAGPPQLQYTPLQQNSDRAISPVRLDSDSLPSTVGISRQERQVLQRFGVVVPNIQQASNIPGSLQSSTSDSANAARYISNRATNSIDAFADHSAADNATMFASTSAASDNGSDEADTKPISAMNFNSLTNLASYPNPMQRAAQKVLASHRPNPAPVLGSQVSDSQSNPYNAEQEPLLSLSGTPMYMAALPRVSGAPAPLTAGPPGVRQLRPTTFEPETLQRAREFDDENPMMNPYNMRMPFVQHIGGPSFEGESISSAPVAETTEEEGEDVEDDNYYGRDMDFIVDTLSRDDASIFYPNGLPTNFNPRTQPISPHWESERREKLEYSVRSREKFEAERRRLVNNRFYAGVHAFNKPLDMAVLEHNHRSVAHIVGRPHKESRNNEGRLISRYLDVREASLIPTSEQYALLSLLFLPFN